MGTEMRVGKKIGERVRRERVRDSGIPASEETENEGK